ncbi:MAG: hypothetical protein COV72_07115 [Candidatus Omnitrophica bacterium CG11_big_fil_rev_8_21_14_0_20_42_13]|uniref:Uncharacterized protein n=1 Tax=Candidatus Ghiorseimicrobium undicola TaxID=1974746 RepID=A0A2H0LW98_9BACT|nr:MAG: hypothetical protein COV72_07115 [Candidatus Omnitrophica bacterium CG11_big_fil_rev_8_21_14_0_20_42_13]
MRTKPIYLLIFFYIGFYLFQLIRITPEMIKDFSNLIPLVSAYGLFACLIFIFGSAVLKRRKWRGGRRKMLKKKAVSFGKKGGENNVY